MEYLFINCVFEDLYPLLKRKVLFFSLFRKSTRLKQAQEANTLESGESTLAFSCEWWGEGGSLFFKI